MRKTRWLQPLLIFLFVSSLANSQEEQIRLFPITDVAPEYPIEAIIRGTEGWVIVSLDVSMDGTVSNVNVRDSEPRLTFDQAAIEAGRKLQFSPYIENGTARDVLGLEYVFRFELSESPEIEAPDREISLNDAASRSPTSQRKPSITQIANEDMLPITAVLPFYPENAETNSLGGWVLLRFIVSQQGTVIDPEVIDSEPQGVFDENAMQAIRQFIYEPKTLDGRAIRTPNVFHMFKFRPSS